MTTRAARFHEGERAMQELAGSRARLAQLAPQILRDHMPDQHRELFEKLPFMLVGSVDADARPWASLLAGSPGFVLSPDPTTLILRADPLPGDPLAEHLHVGAPIGLLGIELSTRRRNRMNGRVVALGPSVLEVSVDQSFGNCPQYIQARAPIARRVGEPALERGEGELSEAATALVRQADTCFIGSAAAEDGGSEITGVDVSHRGGRPGFVRAAAAPAGGTRLTLPDFAGNRFFNTFGNVRVHPRAGMLFVDFERGDLLSVTGRASLVLEGPEVDAFAGAQRLMHLDVERWIHSRDVLPFRFTAPEPAVQVAGTGQWPRLDG